MRLQSRILLLFAVFLPATVSAHPGGTASDGCHYCRTRCDYWGEAWNERHCHGAKAKHAVKQKANPTPTPKRSKAKTKKRRTVKKGATPESQWARSTVLVYAVIDGDTVKVKTTSSPASRFKVRFRGIDCPERGEPGAADATEHVTKRLLDKTVVLQSGGAQFDRDRYGRTLAYVERLGVDIGRELIAKKLCVDYSHRYPHPRQERYLRTQNGR